MLSFNVGESNVTIKLCHPHNGCDQRQRAIVGVIANMHPTDDDRDIVARQLSKTDQDSGTSILENGVGIQRAHDTHSGKSHTDCYNQLGDGTVHPIDEAEATTALDGKIVSNIEATATNASSVGPSSTVSAAALLGEATRQPKRTQTHHQLNHDQL